LVDIVLRLRSCYVKRETKTIRPNSLEATP